MRLRKWVVMVIVAIITFHFEGYCQISPGERGVETCGNNWLKNSSTASGMTIGDLDVTGDQITVEARINRTTTYTGGILYAGNVVSKHADPGDVNYLLRPNTAEITTTRGYFRTPDICDIQLGKTYHVALVYDGKTLKFYRNGFLMSQTAASGNLYQNNWLTTIGDLAANPGLRNETFIGFIDEVRIWKIARTQDEIKTYMSSSLPTPSAQSGLVAYYKMSSEQNQQGNTAWNGTLFNNATIAENNPSCSAFIADSCKIVCNVNPNFSYTQDVCDSAHVFFSNLTFQYQSLKWNFGDGTNSNALNPNKTYNKTGSYKTTLIAEDFTGCIDSISKQVNVSKTPKSLVQTHDTSVCIGSAIQLSGKSFAFRNYNWLPTTYLDNPRIPQPVATPNASITYVVTAIDANNCSISDTVVITVVPKPTVSTINDTAICEKTSVVLTTKTTGANTISWSPSQGLSSNATASPTASPLANTTYTITAGNGTCTVQDNVTVTVKPAPVAVVSPNATICNTQQLQLNASGGVGYQWQPSSGLSDANSANPIAKPNTTTKYFVFVTGSNNCVSKDSVSITVNPYPQFSVAPAQSNVCVGNNISITAAGGDTYTWYDNNGLYSSGSASIQPQPATNTRYKAVIVNTACNIVDSIFSNITVSPEMVTTLSKSNDVDCTIGQAQLTATGAAKYQWYPADHVSNPNIANPLVTPGQTTMYHVKMTSADGCEKIDSIEVKVTGGITETGYLVSSAFTPNGDGINDCFGVKKWGFVTDLEFSIFSRWGERVFYTKDASRCWDGSFKNNAQPAGAYIYLIKAKTFCGTVLRRGTVVLIR